MVFHKMCFQFLFPKQQKSCSQISMEKMLWATVISDIVFQLYLWHVLSLGERTVPLMFVGPLTHKECLLVLFSDCIPVFPFYFHCHFRTFACWFASVRQFPFCRSTGVYIPDSHVSRVCTTVFASLHFAELIYISVRSGRKIAACSAPFAPLIAQV